MRSSVRVRSLSAGLIFGLLSGLVAVLPPLPAAAADPLVTDRSVPVTPVVGQPSSPVKMPEYVPPPAVLPSGGSAQIAVSSAGTAGGLPVSLSAADPGELQTLSAAEGPSTAKVTVADPSVASLLGVHGVVFGVSRADGVTNSGKATLGVDYRGWAGAFGAGFGERLRLVKLPACALLDPQAKACQTQTPVESSNADGVVSGEVDLPSAEALTAAPSGSLSMMSAAQVEAAEDAAAAGEGAAVYAVTASASGASGDFTQTSLSPAYSWQAGTAGGSFSWSYPFKVPASLGGPQPSLALTYDSGSVDGKTFAANGQASMMGEGWSDSLGGGYIERSYKSCADDGGSTSDLCWFAGDNASIVFQGKSTQLVRDASGWKTADDSGWKIEKITSAGNFDDDGEAWKITTLDGVQYTFGKHWAYSGAVTNAVQWVPVYGNNSGEPCFGQQYACVQAYRWNLDYVVDPSGNSMTYFYTPSSNNYGGANNTVIYGYTAAAYLSRIEYGTRAGAENATPPFQVVIDSINRCQAACSYPTDYVDTPLDLHCWSGTSCPNNPSPSFWTAGRISAITTKVYSGTNYRTVDSWALAHSYPAATGETPNLWLDSITHTGFDDAASAAEPAVWFSGVPLANRVPGGSGAQNVHYRVNVIWNGTGGRTNVTYSGVDCPAYVAAFNPHRCYPQYTTAQAGDPASWLWFNKFVVAKIEEVDLMGSSPTESWTYTYGTNSAVDQTLWAHDLAETSKVRGWWRWVGYPDVTVNHGTGTDGTAQVSKSVFYRGMFKDAMPHPDNFTRMWDSRFRQAAVVAPLGEVPGAQGNIAGSAGKCLNIITNGTTNGLGIVLYDCDGRAANIWRYDHGTQMLYNPNSGRCLDVTGTGTANGTPVQLFDCHGGAAQQWRWGPEGTLINPNSGRCLDATGFHTANGTALQIYDCNISPNQIFTPRADGQIQSQQARRCMDLIGGTTTAGTKVGTGFCGLEQARQTWKYNTTAATPGQGTISITSGTNCLEIETGNLLQLNPCGTGAGQVWEPQTNGSLKNPGTGLCIDATEDPIPGERLTVAACTGSLTQLWAHQLTDLPGLAGKTRQSTIMDGAAVVSSSINSFSHSTTGTRAKADPTSHTVFAYRVLPVRSQTKTFRSWNATWRWTDVQTTYDATYPNLVSQVKDYGDTSTSSDNVCTSTTYNANPGAMLIAFPKETLNTTCGAVSGDGDFLGGKHFYYDGATTDVAPTKGLLTKTTSATGQNVEGIKTWIQSGRSTYDVHGRAIESYDALDRKTTTAFTPATGGPVTSIKATNALGHFSTLTLNDRGQTVTATDPNGKVTTAAYDPLGRVVKVWQPGNAGGTPDAEYGYALQGHAPNPLAPSYTTAKVLGPNGNQITSFQIYDGRLRPRQAQTPAPDGKRVITDTKYDSRGLAVKAATFYNSASVPNSTLESYMDTAVDAQTRNTFDGVGRQLTSELWSKNALKWKTTNSYGGDRVGTTPPTGGTATTVINDARGRTTALRQHQGGTPGGAWTATLYSYDRIGQLTKVTDPGSNEWLYEYDLLGRKTKTTDPDAGVSTTAYDNGGQVTSTTDARNQQLWFEYDLLGRTTKSRADTAAGTVLSDAVYDTVAKGQLTSTSRYDASGEFKSAVSSYNNAYQPLTTTFTAPGFGSSGGTLTYSVVNTYKTNGAPATTYVPSVGGLPDETYTYTYTSTGQLSTLASEEATYIASSAYTFDSQLSQQVIGAAGKQVRLTNSFEAATRRPTTSKTETETATPGTFAEKMASTLSFDNAGNITSIAGKTNGTADQEECFRYDHLRRMTEAWTQTSGTCTTPQKTGADAYWRAWTFDSIGNRLTQIDKNTDGTTGTSWTSTVGAAGSVKPHQVSKVDATGPLAGTPTRSFGYTAGNMTSRTTETNVAQTLEWDKEGHLATVKEGTATVASYIYDPAGQRLVGAATSGGVTKTTLYLPDGTELEKSSGGGALLGQRYIGGVAVRSGVSGLMWTISNHQGTHSAQIDPGNLAVTQRRMMPYGETRGAQQPWLGTKGYVGGTKDTPTGLTHLGAREYDPSIGRFISIDPVMDLADPQQWNAYSYSNNSPITGSDPTGLKQCIEGDDCDGKTATFCNSGCQEANYIATLNAQKKAAEGESKKSIKDILIEVGADLLLDILGVNDILDCFTKGDLMACGSMVLGFMPWGKAAKAGAALFKAFDRGLSAYKAWRKAVDAGKAIIKKSDDLLAAAKGRLDDILAKGDDVGGACAKHSFDPDTLVLMADGTTKRIGDIKVGDKVAATDPETGETTSRTVEHVFINLDEELTNVEVELPDGSTEVIETTAHHPFWDASTKEWTSASKLEPGHSLFTPNGASVKVASVHNFLGYQEMRDLTVASLHTYYVIAGSTPVLVHNCGEDFYRTMSQDHFDTLQSTGKLSATRETFISPTRAFSEGYDGVLVKFTVKDGTTQRLAEMGVRDNSSITSRVLSSMPLVGKGWRNRNAFFKGEGKQINIGLGGGDALDLFNGAITSFKRLS